jgi:uncharacterized protein (DUF58 family)
MSLSISSINTLRNKLEKYAQEKQRIYIIPTARGFKYIFINFTLFLIALSYANNMALLISFLMLSYFIIQMFETHSFIKNIGLSKMTIENTFSDQNVMASVYFKNRLNTKQSRYMRLELQANENKAQSIKTSRQSFQNLIFTFKNLPRSHYKLTFIKFFTYGTHQFFYVWKYDSTLADFYIYPKKQKADVSLKTSSTNQTNGQVEFAYHIPYTTGLSSKRIDWKVFARNEQLYWKKHIDYKMDIYDINFYKITGESKEEKLEKMCYLVEFMYKNGFRWKLSLPTKEVKSSAGRAHYQKSLELLSEA